MDRPTGVTILAVLNFLGAGLYILIGLLFILGMGILGGMMGQAGGEGSAGAMGMMMGLGAVAGVVFIVLSLIPLLIGWGLWELKNWGRIISIVLFSPGALAGPAGAGARPRRRHARRGRRAHAPAPQDGRSRRAAGSGRPVPSFCGPVRLVRDRPVEAEELGAAGG